MTVRTAESVWSLYDLAKRKIVRAMEIEDEVRARSLVAAGLRNSAQDLTEMADKAVTDLMTIPCPYCDDPIVGMPINDQTTAKTVHVRTGLAGCQVPDQVAAPQQQLAAAVPPAVHTD